MEKWKEKHKITANRFENHHEYYLRLSKAMGIGWPKHKKEFMGFDLDFWTERYREDEHLNNVSLSRFDLCCPYHLTIASHLGIPWSISNTVCCLKAVIKERVMNF